jgi:hypothetical protein
LLAADYFGYYSGMKEVGGSHRNKLGHLFHQEFPMDIKGWRIEPVGQIDDAPVDEGYQK